jgi:2-C-methyl-D-erythritol 4-phosphate cytidylyltransferase
MSTNMKVAAILLGAGSSRRMNGVDKIMMPLLRRPLLSYSLERLDQSSIVNSIVVVTTEHNEMTIRRFVEDQMVSKVSAICVGGTRRQDSVRIGLQHVTDATHVLVHDGARPLVDRALIERGVKAVLRHEAAIAAVPVKDTIKRAGGDMLVLETIPREHLWAVQTPQIFEHELLKAGHQTIREDVTDDATMIERLGHKVKIFMGSYENIKVTTAEDVAIAEALIRSRSAGNIA